MSAGQVLTLEILIGDVSRLPLRVYINDQLVHTVTKPLPRTELVESKRFVKQQERVSINFTKPHANMKSLPLAIRLTEGEASGEQLSMRGEIDVLADGLWCNVRQQAAPATPSVVLRQRKDDQFDAEGTKTVELISSSDDAKKKQQQAGSLGGSFAQQSSAATAAGSGDGAQQQARIVDGNPSALVDRFRPATATAEGRPTETFYLYLGNIAASASNPCEVTIDGELALRLTERGGEDELLRFVLALPATATSPSDDPDAPHHVIDVGVQIRELDSQFEKRFDLTANGTHVLLGVVPQANKIRILQKSQPSFAPLRDTAQTSGNPLQREVKVYLRGIPASTDMSFAMRIQQQEVARLTKPISSQQLAVVSTQVIPTNGVVTVTLIIPSLGFDESDPIVEEFDLVDSGAHILFDCSEGELKIKQEHAAFDPRAL